MLDKYKYTSPGILSQELVARALGLEELFVGDSVENTANEGATFSGAFIWGKNMLIFARAPTPGLMVANGAYTFVWNRGGAFPWGIDSYRDDPVSSDITRVRSDYDIKVVSKQHGYYINTAVA